MADVSAEQPVFKKRKRAPPAPSADDAAPSLKELLASVSDTNPAQDGDAAGGTAAGNDQPENEDESTSVQDLLLLRQLSKRPTGIELNKLNRGERKKKKKAKADGAGGPRTAEEQWAEQMARGGLMSGAGGGGDEDEDDDADKGDSSKRLVRNNFQGETNIVDVDKHMMAYIEEEMRKRSGRTSSETPSAAQVRAALSNPEDELYKVAEKYRQLQGSNESLIKKAQDDEEGNVTLSTTMLTSIPEVDLGMDVRLKNIEETEKAKRLLAEQRKAEGPRRRDDGDDQFAAARFYRPKYSTQSDLDALKMAQEGYDPTSEITLPPDHAPAGSGAASASMSSGRGDGHGGRRAMATDEMVMERFKKRQRQQLKR